MAWWVHDHLNYSSLFFFPRLAAFNIGWSDRPERVIGSYIEPRGVLTKPGMLNHSGPHAEWYAGFPNFRPQGSGRMSDGARSVPQSSPEDFEKMRGAE